MSVVLAAVDAAPACRAPARAGASSWPISNASPISLRRASGNVGALERRDLVSAAGRVERRVALVLVADGHGGFDLLVGQRATLTRATIAGSLAGGANSRFGLPTAARSFSCRSSSGWAAWCANISASTMSSSLQLARRRPRP